MKCKIVRAKRSWITWDGQECSFDGYDVTIPTVMGSTTTSVETISEAFSLVGKFTNEEDFIEEERKRLSAYLSSDAGAWGRSDGYGRG